MRRFSLLTLAMLVALGGACFALAGVVLPHAAQAEQHRSYLRIGEAGGSRPLRLGLNKAMIVELPRAVREVMVSNPGQIDAVMQTATRAYLTGRAVGEANVIFVDKDGRQIVTLEVAIERDLQSLGGLLSRLIPNSHIQVEGIGERVVLSGTVTNPIDAARACEIVTSFLGPLDQLNGNASASGGGSAVTVTTGSTQNGGSGLSSSCLVSNVINLITVEGREQVLLKVSVVEMERNIIKQFGIDLGTLINSGNFAFAALSNLPFPINTQGKGLIAPFLPNDVALPAEAIQGTPSFVTQGVAGGGVLRRAGVKASLVVLEPYFANGDPTAPLRLSYLQFVAEHPDCPDWSENIGRDPNNMPWPNKACASQRNLAAMVANPEDLIHPRGETPRPSERRDTVWGKYIAGDSTGSNWTPGGQPLSERAAASDVQASAE